MRTVASSSTTRMRYLPLAFTMYRDPAVGCSICATFSRPPLQVTEYGLRSKDRQIDPEDRTGAHLAFDREPAGMVLDDSPDNPESQPRTSLAFGGHKRLKNGAKDFRR